MSPQTPPVVPFTSSLGNAFLLPTPQGFLAVDVGSPAVARRMVKYVQKSGGSPQDIRLATATHLHPDHIGGLHDLQRLTHCAIQLHRQARRRRNPPSSTRQLFLERLADLSRPWRLRFGKEWLLTPPVKRPLPFHVQGWFENNTLLPGGWRAIYTPGHTRESISLYHPKHQILLVGDTLIGMRGGLRTNPFNDDGEVLNMSLCTLEQLRVKIVYPGRGRPARGQQAFNKALRKTTTPTLPMRLLNWLPA
jgi:glyoxylase-like metal-dependent hydrolase (beta-lactamase superfamily II)